MKVFSVLLIGLATLFTASTPTSNDGYQLGDVVADFKLKNVDGNKLSLADYPDAKGFILIFTCNTCPVAVANEDRIIALDQKYKALGYPVIAINPNDAGVAPRESYEQMQQRAKDKGFTFPYLLDPDHVVTKRFAATHTPHTFLLQKTDNGNVLQYIGAIDDDSRGGNPSTKFVEEAIAALEAGKSPDPNKTKAVGCTIKWKKSE
ncbi:thioredoxin family protein [Parapedobacter tibetensis]|uniref:thioredoxin family protein n=1 Tax=Parapedobacter tibetensis TaxID=2972951 RepID=UPI00214D6A0A|nr:thioredoxin family protein [Parapedobacter tibetensis]